MAHADAQLSELAAQMKSTIQGSFVPTLEEMKHRFDHAMGDMDAWADDIHDALTEIRDRLPQQLAELSHAWQAHGHEMQEVHGQTMEAGHAYEEQLQHAQTSVHDSQSTASDHGTSLHHGLDQVRDLGHKVGEEVSHHLTDWMHTIDSTLHEAGEKASHIEQNMTHLGAELAHGVANVVGQIGHAASSVAEHVAHTLDQFGNDLEHMNGEQHDHLLEQIGSAIGGDVGEVISTVEAFMRAGEEMHQLFDGGLGKVLESVEEVNKVIKEIKPVIELAETLL